MIIKFRDPFSEIKFQFVDIKGKSFNRYTKEKRLV